MSEKALSLSLVQSQSLLNVSSYRCGSGLHVTIINLTLSFFFGRGQFPSGKPSDRPVGGVGGHEPLKL